MRKNVLIICACVVLLAAMCWLLYDSSLMYDGNVLSSGDLSFGTHITNKICYVGTYTWSSDSKEAVLDIPDVCDGYRVVHLGGFFGNGVPDPFCVQLPDAEAIYHESALPEDAEIEQYHLIINIGKNLEDNRFIMMEAYYSMGENRFVQILVTVNCHEDNPYFYSQNGKLYKRADGSLVEGFFYYSDDQH